MMNVFAGGLGMGFNRREATCLTVAFVAHALLFLWKGGMIMLPESGSMPLGDPLLQVGYMSDVPEYSEPGAPGEEGRKRGLMGRVKQFFAGGSDASKPATKAAPEVAMGGAVADKIENAGPTWAKAESSQLVDKSFSDKKNFKGLQSKSEFAVASGKEADVIVENRSIGTAASASPNLKEKTFQVAKRDMPFQIATGKEMDQLSNVNMVPVTTGRTTSASVTSMDAPGSGGVVGGAALKSKSAGSSAAGASGGFSGMSRSGGNNSGTGASTSGGLAMGSASGGGMIDAGGLGSGTSGTGTGGGGATLGGQGTGKGGGRGQGGGSPYGVIGGQGTGTGMLPRRQLTVQDTVSNSSANGETITGELSRRPIREKSKPPYEMDARVALRFRVNAAGKVLDGIVVEVSSGSPSFDNKVIAALKKWIFSTLPAEKSNVIQEGVITFIFRGE